MKRSTNIRWSELKVGLVMVASLAIVAIAVVTFGYLADLLRPKEALSAVFGDVRGLRTGAPVWLGGVEAGYVKKIHFPTQAEQIAIQVEMMVDRELASLIRADSTASVRTQGLLGDIYVEIALGSPSALPLPAGRPLEGIVPVDIKQLVSGSSETLGELSLTLRKLNGMLTKINDGQGAAGRFVTDPALYDELTHLATDSRQLLKEIEKGEGSAGKLLRDPQLYQRLTAAVERVETTAKSFEQLSDAMRHGEGTVGKLTRDPAVYDHLASSTATLDRLLGKVEAGEGIAGQLVTDKELSEELRSAITEFKSAATEFRGLVADVKEHPKKYFQMKLF
jgi:phospholipid/cholesterol/gamma-HCH transport system substrate-binding protein